MSAGILSPDLEWAYQMYDTLGRGGPDEVLFYLEVPGDPWSKSRPRFARNGRTYRPKDDQAAEANFRSSLTAAGAPWFTGNVMVACRFYRSNAQRIDADNLLKHVCDSSTGIMWEDDCQVTLVLGEVHHDPENPRSIIMVGNHWSSLARGTDREVECPVCSTPFVPRSGKPVQRFCSNACSHKGRATALEQRTCVQCGGTFTPGSHRQKLCGAECRVVWMRGRRQENARPLSCCAECGRVLTHHRGGRCRECWRANPKMYVEPES